MSCLAASVSHPRLDRGGRAWLVATGVVSYAAARGYAAHAFTGPVLCPLRALTGLPCPGCGLTRALCVLSSGELTRALALNATALPLALFAFAAVGVAAAELVRGRAWQFYRPWLHAGRLWRLSAGGVLGYHAARMAYWAATGVLTRDWHASWLYRALTA